MAPPLTDVSTHPRILPHFDFDPRRDWYPDPAKRQRLSGSVLVEFEIKSDGHPASLKVVQAEADPILQSAAVDLVRHVHFDVADRAYDPQDPAPFRLAVTYCIVKCVRPPPTWYAGKVAKEIVITGTPLRR